MANDIFVVDSICLCKFVHGVCHRMSSASALPNRHDSTAWTSSIIVGSITLYNISNTRGLDGDFRHLVKPERFKLIATVIRLSGFASK